MTKPPETREEIRAHIAWLHRQMDVLEELGNLLAESFDEQPPPPRKRAQWQAYITAVDSARTLMQSVVATAESRFLNQ